MTAAGVWTKEMDDELIERRVVQKLKWRSVAPIGCMNAKKCQGRLKVLQNGRPEVAKAVAESSEKAELEDYDGLDWLVRKKRLSHAQGLKGYDYRRLFRRALPGAPIKSNFGMELGGGAFGSGLPNVEEYGDASAKLDLFVIRWNVLLGQADLLTVMNGVCGIGHTVRMLAGGNQLRAAQLEAALRIALDLMIASDQAKNAALAKRAEKAA